MRKRIAILCGGRSSEHEISCISAGGVLGAIDRDLFDPVVIGITKSGIWVLLPEEFDLSIQSTGLPSIPEDAPRVVADATGLSVDGKSLDIEIVFPLLHGPYGEDGTIQGLLEMMDIAYVGSGVLACAVAMDKSFAKPIFQAHGMKVAAGFTATKKQWDIDPDEISDQARQLGYPIFVKPARGGSSKGTSKVKHAKDLAAALATAHIFDPKAIIEQAVEGDEIECAVLEIDGVPQASIVGKIVIDSRYEFYDFEAKYLDGSTTIKLPAPISDAISEEIRALAVSAFTSLGCSGLARVDFFLTKNGEIIINEINTMPGFTATSVFPKMWQATGMGYKQVITELLKTAAMRTNGVLGN
jgi:D-alanine-D-alanine ligase